LRPTIINVLLRHVIQHYNKYSYSYLTNQPFSVSKWSTDFINNKLGTPPGSLTMRFFSQSHLYDDPWSIVSLAFFLRYPNPYASHVVSCDVISRTPTPSGSLLTTRLILKHGSLPKWAPKGIVSRAESWILEESEVDPEGKIMRCRTRNLDHVKVMRVEETVVLRPTEDGKTLQINEASIVSRFGWGLTKRIENHGLARFKANVQRSREGVSLILSLLRQSRLQAVSLTADGTMSVPSYTPSTAEKSLVGAPDIELKIKDGLNRGVPSLDDDRRSGPFTKLLAWFRG